MNVLLLSPGINKKYNDNYFVYEYMAKMGNNVLAITQRQHINKGTGTQISSKIEIEGRIEIHRLFDTWSQQKTLRSLITKFPQITNILSGFSPDVIICEELSNMPLALKIKKEFNIPLVLRVEFAYNYKHPYRTMGVFLKKFRNKLSGDYFSILIGKLIWRWASKNAESIISCFFGDATKDSEGGDSSLITYVPWPTFLSKSITNPKKIKKRAVFVGSFEKHKNLRELEITIPLLFENTPIEEFYIVGTGDELIVIENLKAKYPNRIKHFTSLTRNECLELISSCYISYSPAIMGGWGFIGDSFAMKTPIVVTHNHYGFNDRVDSILTTKFKIVDRVNELYSNSELYSKISSGGYERFVKHHTSEGVGHRFIKICETAIQKYK